MPADLQHLLRRIRTEAVEVSEEESSAILEQARSKAAGIVRDAEAQAKRMREEAEAHARLQVESGTRALEQAGRDILISVGQGIQRSIDEIVGQAVDEAYGPEFLQELMAKAIDAYLEQGAAASGIEVEVAEEEADRVVAFVKSRYQQALGGGIAVTGDATIRRGFRLSFDGVRAFHDFSGPSIAEALSARLRPHLAEIIHRVARES